MLATEPKQLFISVGSRFEMNRLLQSVEKVVKHNPGIIAKAQTLSSSFQSKYVQTTQWANAVEFEQAVTDCDIFISHAGMGNVLLAAKHRKPIIIMPRRADLGEHTSDHQLGTAIGLLDRPMINIVNDAAELEQAVLSILKNASREDYQQNVLPQTGENLVTALKDFINNGKI